MIRADRIDILNVLAGHTFGNRIGVAAFTPAPVQVSMYDLTTSGLDTMDWFLGDEILTPHEDEEEFTERIARLPCLFLHMPIEEAKISERSDGFLVLGSCCNPAKLSDDVVSVWSRVLTRLPDARLNLKYRESYGDRALAADVRQRFADHGIATSRLNFDGRRSNRRDHLAYVGGFDIALDTFPFNGSTTTYEALWMGVPVVTMLGRRFVGRLTAGALRQLDLPELVAVDPDDYVRIAVGLAADSGRRQALRRELRSRLKRSRLLDAPGHARTVEAAYRMMWRRWCESGGEVGGASVRRA